MKSVAAKIVLSAVGVAFLLATPADAAKRKHRAKAAAAHTRVKHQHHQRHHQRGVASSNRNTVTFGPYTLGADPDPNIRHQLERDLSGFFGGDM